MGATRFWGTTGASVEGKFPQSFRYAVSKHSQRSSLRQDSQETNTWITSLGTQTNLTNTPQTQKLQGVTLWDLVSYYGGLGRCTDSGKISTTFSLPAYLNPPLVNVAHDTPKLRTKK